MVVLLTARVENARQLVLRNLRSSHRIVVVLLSLPLLLVSLFLMVGSIALPFIALHFENVILCDMDGRIQ